MLSFFYEIYIAYHFGFSSPESALIASDRNINLLDIFLGELACNDSFDVSLDPSPNLLIIPIFSLATSYFRPTTLMRKITQ